MIFLVCFVLCNLLYPAILDAQMSAREAERLIQKFERMELDDLIKDESLYLEYNHFYTAKIVDTFF